MKGTASLKKQSLGPSRKDVGTEIFDAASSPIRMRILKLLSARGPLPYTEIMFAVKLDPVRDAGKFVYHLRSLLGAGLVSLNEEAKKYDITELGRMIVNFARSVEEYVAVKKGKMFVRTSKLSIEEFDREKIADSLVREASVPYELAQEIAAEAEERLIKLETKYLTAPLIREFVNSILVEKKLEEYRHKLTRLGMPVYDVTQLFNFASEKKLDVKFVQERAGESVLKEYVLLNALPKDIADAHLSGDIHLDKLEGWVLAPNEVRHDARFFLRRGLGAEPPKSFNEALALLRKVFRLFSREVLKEQQFDMFNVFLAPYVNGITKEEVRRALLQFMEELNPALTFGTFNAKLSLGLEFFIPKFLEGLEAVAPKGGGAGVYGDYAEEASLILEALMEAASELLASRPLLNPLLIFKVREGALQNEEVKLKLLRCHEMASKFSLPYLTFLGGEERASYSSEGLRLSGEPDGRWETNCLRTGNAGAVLLNVPRIAHEAQGSDERFKELLSEALVLAVEALRSKKENLRSALKNGLLPLLSKPLGGLVYYADETPVYSVGFVGLNEAAVIHVGTGVHADEDAFKFIFDSLRRLSKEAASLSRKLGIRLSLAQIPNDEASCRFAKLDVEKYGRAAAVAQGSPEHPYYTDVPTIPLSLRIPLENRIKIEARIQGALGGG
ncbi:TPA: hypothetical protein EYP26_06350, partial [Candidatus Bathyarchaeota archaeon]|nr:hypothetical protein [Candidatus Bathyarchaeota archaeon]